MKRRTIIGVDGGSTKTHLAVSDESGRLLQRRSSGSTNHQSTDQVGDNFLELFNPYEGQRIETAVLTLSGWDFRRDREILSQHVQSTLKILDIKVERLITDNDVFAVLKSGMGTEQKGICLAAGTGILGAAWNGEKRIRTYGFGELSGEWGSGSDIGQEALHLVLASSLGREEPYPLLTDAALDFFRTTDAEQLAEIICRDDFDFDQFSLFSHRVFDLIQKNSSGAMKVLTKAGTEQAKTVNGLLKRAGLQEAPLILGGGVFQHNGLLPGFIDTLSPVVKDIRLVRSDPVFGALLWALEASSIETKEIEKQIQIERIRI